MAQTRIGALTLKKLQVFYAIHHSRRLSEDKGHNDVVCPSVVESSTDDKCPGDVIGIFDI